MGNSHHNQNTSSSSHQGDLSRLISNYLQDQNNAFHNMSNYNTTITKCHLSKVLNSKSILSNAKLLSYKLFTQSNITTLNTNAYQCSFASPGFVSENLDIINQLNETNNVLLKKNQIIYKKKHIIEVSSSVSYYSAVKENQIENNRNIPIAEESMKRENYNFVQDHTQLNYESNTAIGSVRQMESRLNQTDIIYHKAGGGSDSGDERTFDDMNLQEYLNEEAKSIRHNQSLRGDLSNNHNQNNSKSSINNNSSNNHSTTNINYNLHKTALKSDKKNIKKKSKKNNKNKTKKITPIYTQFNTINYNSLYDNEYDYNNINNTDQNDYLNNNKAIQMKIPMKKYKSPNNVISKNINLLNNKHINNTHQKPTSYQSFTEHLNPKHDNQPIPLHSSQKNKISHKSTSLSKHNSMIVKGNNTLSNMNYHCHSNTKGDKKNVGNNDKHNHSHMNMNYTPKSTRITSMKTSFTSRNDNNNSNKRSKTNIGRIDTNTHANSNSDYKVKENGPMFNIKIDLRDLMKDDFEVEEIDPYNNHDNHNDYIHNNNDAENKAKYINQKELNYEPESFPQNDTNNNNDEDNNHNLIGDFYVDIERDLNDNENEHSFRMNTQPKVQLQSITKTPSITTTSPNPLNFTIFSKGSSPITPKKDCYRSSLDRLIITQQKVDHNGKIII